MNVFHFWAGRDPDRTVHELDVVGTASHFAFEENLPSGARDIPALIDWLLIVAIRSPTTDASRSVMPELSETSPRRCTSGS